MVHELSAMPAVSITPNWKGNDNWRRDKLDQNTTKGRERTMSPNNSSGDNTPPFLDVTRSRRSS
jgi:hypothetical protein